ncbi:MAG: 2-dehydro-3-deoxygluconate kinase [uncultured Propionibacteriaceae bacterium]|uniref:2-dehydro-3-deoxygluconate kinase n=1 Tax=uncultured Propionibacteriaceae bacterium TaxID=257457 RepID=A0A6J4PJC2_9ACTN|nr:MAG: 2-dehydro-3-deoxygluconate kinase [uncultured Propionibacteriaceae bacterium]
MSMDIPVGSLQPSTAEIVTFGEAMTLLLATDDLPLLVADRLGIGIAGAESNLATGLARLGHQVAYFGRVGADVFGERIRRGLRAEGIDVSYLISDPELPTGLLIRDSTPGRPITVNYRRAGSAASATSVADIPRDVIEQARVLHATGITAALSPSAYETTLEAMTLAREAGVTVTFDPNIRLRLADIDRWRQIIDVLARQADIVFTGADESKLICVEEDPAEWYTERGATIVVVKDGVNGATEYGPEGTVHEGARTVTAVDPVGAGDAFNAGWLSAWLHGLPEVDRLRQGSAVASLVVATRGDSTGLPDATIRNAILADSQDIDR